MAVLDTPAMSDCCRVEVSAQRRSSRLLQRQAGSQPILYVQFEVRGELLGKLAVEPLFAERLPRR